MRRFAVFASSLLLCSAAFAAETSQTDTCPPPPQKNGEQPPPPPDNGNPPPPPRGCHPPKGQPGGQPPGPPPGGRPGGKPGDTAGMPPPGGHTAYTLQGAYTLSGKDKKKTETGKTYRGNGTDMSAIYVNDGASLTLQDAKVITHGNSSSNENSSFYGLNAALLATGGGDLTMEGGSILTTGSGANGAFAGGRGARVTLRTLTIRASGNGGHGVDAATGGALMLEDVTVDTQGQSSAAVATDRGGGTIVVTGGHFVTHGFRSPGIYSTGDITVSHASFRAEGAEAAVIEGANSIVLRDTDLFGQKSRGVMIYQSFSGDAQGQRGRFTMRGGSLTAEEGPAFYVNNTTAIIRLSGVKITAPTLLEARADHWGVKGKNGGHAFLTAEKQTLKGDVVSDRISSASLDLKAGSSLTGKIVRAALKLDASSRWTVTADSALTDFSDQPGFRNGHFANVASGGHTVSYVASRSANAWLGGKSYALPGGGKLVPAK